MFHPHIALAKPAGGAVSLLSGMALIGVLAGCQLTEDRPVENKAGGKNTLAVAAAITNTTFTDGTGKIRIRVKTCDPTAAAYTNCAYCTADEGWLRIGGGANIIGESTPGAMLQASFPSPNYFTSVNSYGCTGAASSTGLAARTWVTRASGAQHQLQAYVIQMQLIDAQGQAFLPSTTEGIDNVASPVNPPATYSVVSPGYALSPSHILIGGGGTVFTTNPAHSITAATGSYLVESRPVITQDGMVWKASARSTISPPAEEALKAYAIAVEACPQQWAGECLTTPMIKQFSAAATTGYGTAAYTVNASWVNSAPGGYAPTTNSNPRFLADLIPFNGSNKGFTVRSKGNGSGGSGMTYGSTLVFGNSMGYYTQNHVHFFFLGKLSRPSGTNPQLQQSATAASDQPATRWHFEPYGTGTYRLRNGNPDGGTECAYRDGSTSNVRVKACGSGNEFKWIINGIPYGLTLKNATNNLCLDANGTSGTTNVALKTCTSGNGQLMHLGAVNWPN